MFLFNAFFGKSIRGSDKSETLVGSIGDDHIDAKGGDDVVFARAGDDTVLGGEHDDVIFGGFGADDLFGESGDDALFGGFGKDDLSGGEGDDHLNGGFGKDTLEGGFGDDVKIGGAGRDTFVYGDGDGAANGEIGDTILDFDVDKDSFALRAGEFGVQEELKFQNVERDAIDDVDAGLVGLNTDNNAYVLQGVWNNAGQAANAVVDAGEEDDFFFVYYNVNLDVNRLFFADVSVDGEGEASVAIQQLANLGDLDPFGDDSAALNDGFAIAQLAEFSADNFAFV